MFYQGFVLASGKVYHGSGSTLSTRESATTTPPPMDPKSYRFMGSTL